MSPVAKMLIVLGFVLIFAGLIWHFTGGNIPLGRLPGDIRIEGERSKIYIPITSCLLISALIWLIQYLMKFWK